MEKKDLGRCSQKVYGNSRFDSFHPHQCHFKGVVVYEGKVYCKRHNPVYIEKKRKEKNQEWDVAFKKRQERFEREKYSVIYCENLSLNELERRVKKGERIK